MMRWSVERVLLIATFVSSAAAFVFGVGVQWAKTTSIEAAVSAIQQQYVRQDVYASDQRALSQSIHQLTIAIDRLTEARNQQAVPRGSR